VDQGKDGGRAAIPKASVSMAAAVIKNGRGQPELPRGVKKIAWRLAMDTSPTNTKGPGAKSSRIQHTRGNYHLGRGRLGVRY